MRRKMVNRMVLMVAVLVLVLCFLFALATSS
jgi:hypothetical protein